MRARFPTLLRFAAFTTTVVALAAPVAAQRPREPLVVGATLGHELSSHDAYPGGAEIGGLVEVPFTPDVRIRGEVGIGFWGDDLPPFDDIRDGDLRRVRLAGSFIKTLAESTSRTRLGTYVGGGAGIYLYRFSERDDSSGFGFHGLGGVEYLLRQGGNRWLVGGEAQLQIIGAPEGPADDDLLKVLHVAGFVKYRLRR
jgi:hypothetical protein